MPDKPSIAKRTILHGIGLILTTIGTGVAAHFAEVGAWLQQHPSLATGVSAGVAAILYGWGLLTVSLWRKDSKRSKIREAKELGRPICGCTEAGEIMLATDWGTSFLRDHECPICKSKQQVKIRD